MQESGAASAGEPDVKFDEAVFEFINSARREHKEELYYGAMFPEAMRKELVEAARKVEMETFMKHGECEYRCRLVLKEIKKDEREELILKTAKTPPPLP